MPCLQAVGNLGEEAVSVGKTGKNRRRRAKAQRRNSRRDTQRMSEPKPKPTTDTMRGGFKPGWERDA